MIHACMETRAPIERDETSASLCVSRACVRVIQRARGLWLGVHAWKLDRSTGQRAALLCLCLHAGLAYMHAPLPFQFMDVSSQSH